MIQFLDLFFKNEATEDFEEHNFVRIVVRYRNGRYTFNKMLYNA